MVTKSNKTRIIFVDKNYYPGSGEIEKICRLID